MSALVWDRDVDRVFEHGVDHGVLFTEYMNGDPSKQNLSDVLCTSGTGMEFYYPAYSEQGDYVPDTRTYSSLIDKNVYNWNLNFSWGGGPNNPEAVSKWTKHKALNTSDGTTLVDSQTSGVSDYISMAHFTQEIVSQGGYSLWFWCYNADIFPIDIYFYNGNPVTFIERKTVTGVGDFDGGKYVTFPEAYFQTNASFRIVIHGFKDDGTMITAKSLCAFIQHTEDEDVDAPGGVNNTLQQWIQACARNYAEASIDLSEFPETYYKYGRSIYGGHVWNGLTSVTESPEGAEKTDVYADNIKYASLRSAETFGGTIEAYTYPEQLKGCNGEVELMNGMTIHQQPRTHFGFAYRSSGGPDERYKLHIVYNSTASPSERAYETVNDSPDAITFSWEFDSTPVPFSRYKPTSIVTIDILKYWQQVNPEVPTEAGVITDPIHILEALLFGTSQSDSFLPSPEFVYWILNRDRPLGLKQVPYISDAVLTDITLTGGQLDRTFNPNVTEYAVYYNENTVNITSYLQKYKEDAVVGTRVTSGWQIEGECFTDDASEMQISGVETRWVQNAPSLNSKSICMKYPVSYDGQTVTYSMYFLPESQKNTMLSGVSFGNLVLDSFDPLMMNYVDVRGQNFYPSYMQDHYHPMNVYYDSRNTASTGTITFDKPLDSAYIYVDVYDKTTNSFVRNISGPGYGTTMQGFNLDGHDYRMLVMVTSTGSVKTNYFIEILNTYNDSDEEPVEVDEPIEVEVSGG